MENNEKQVDHGINNSTFINITGKGEGRETVCKRTEKFMQILSKMSWFSYKNLSRGFHITVSCVLVFADRYGAQ